MNVIPEIISQAEMDARVDDTPPEIISLQDHITLRALLTEASFQDRALQDEEITDHNAVDRITEGYSPDPMLLAIASEEELGYPLALYDTPIQYRRSLRS